MKTVDVEEGRGPNPYYAENFEGESDELRDLRLSLVAERDALKTELERIKALALEPVMVYHGAYTINCGGMGTTTLRC